jgi:pyruvate formate lyase activating enzyme
MLPLIFDIRHFSLDDGSGIRTTVFMKGCPLSCIWCHNPEGISPSAELPAIDAGGTYCTNSSGMIGKYYSPGELIEILLADRVFYETSGGGVTFSGGEPTFHMSYVSAVTKSLKQSGIHVAMETSGAFKYDLFASAMLPYIDLVYFDLKLMDNRAYKHFVGGDNRLPLDNFRRLCNLNSVEVVATVPLIPGITTTHSNLRATARLIEEAGCRLWIVRPYNPGGISKRLRLGRRSGTDMPESPMSQESVAEAESILHAALGQSISSHHLQ